MGEVSLWAKIFTTLFLMAVAYWAYISEKEESQLKEERTQEEHTLIGNTVHLTTTRNTFERHRDTILDKVAAHKLQSVIITDSKEIPQSVLLPYTQYKIIQEFYDRQVSQEIAPHAKEEAKLADEA